MDRLYHQFADIPPQFSQETFTSSLKYVPHFSQLIPQLTLSSIPNSNQPLRTIDSSTCNNRRSVPKHDKISAPSIDLAQGVRSDASIHIHAGTRRCRDHVTRARAFTSARRIHFSPARYDLPLFLNLRKNAQCQQDRLHPRNCIILQEMTSSQKTSPPMIFQAFTSVKRFRHWETRVCFKTWSGTTKTPLTSHHLASSVSRRLQTFSEWLQRRNSCSAGWRASDAKYWKECNGRG